jgi:hypothetical protein
MSLALTFWIILFDQSYSFTFNLLVTCLLILEGSILLISISICQSFFYSRMVSYRSITSSTIMEDDRSLSLSLIHNRRQPWQISWSNSFRRLMLLRIQALFHRSASTTTSSSDVALDQLTNYRCPVCFNQHHQVLSRWIALGCGHLLCSLCTQRLYFGSKPMCPHCRSPIILSDLTLLYI